MINIYIDESGSMNASSNRYTQQFFIISIIKVNDERALRSNFKRFVSNNLKLLKSIDTDNKMFLNGKFHELKGSALNSALKRSFVAEITKNKPFEIFYIKLLNNKTKPNFFDNKARAFNFILKLFFEHNLRNKKFIDEQYFLQIDERNTKTQSKNTLQEYLNTELILNDFLLTQPLIVKYYDSSNNKYIQVADIFANLYFSECITNAYTNLFKDLEIQGILKEIFVFPKKGEKLYLEKKKRV